MAEEPNVAKPRRPPGRPRIYPGQRMVSLSVTLPEAVYDHLTDLARAHRVDLMPFVRQAIIERFSTKK